MTAAIGRIFDTGEEDILMCPTSLLFPCVLLLLILGGCPADYSAQPPAVSAPLFRAAKSSSEQSAADQLEEKLAEDGLALDLCDGCSVESRNNAQSRLRGARSLTAFPPTAGERLPEYPPGYLRSISRGDRIAVVTGSQKPIDVTSGYPTADRDIVTVYDLGENNTYQPSLVWELPDERKVCVRDSGTRVTATLSLQWVGESYLFAHLCDGSVIINADTGDTTYLDDYFATAASDESGLTYLDSGMLHLADGSVQSIGDESCRVVTTRYTACTVTDGVELRSVISGMAYPSDAKSLPWAVNGERAISVNLALKTMFVTDFSTEPPAQWTIDLPECDSFRIWDWRVSDRWLVATIGYPDQYTRNTLLPSTVISPILVDVEEGVIYQIAENDSPPALRRLY